MMEPIVEGRASGNECLQSEKEKTFSIDKKGEQTLLGNFSVVNEGDANVLFPVSNSVFYNPVQEFNRDLTIALISSFIRHWMREEKNEEDVQSLGKVRRRKIKIFTRNDQEKQNVRCRDFSILEGLAATGLRSVRFATEIPRWVPPTFAAAWRLRVIANDFDPAACDVARLNIARNRVEDVMSATCDDVVMLMLTRVRDARSASNKRRMKMKSETRETESGETVTNRNNDDAVKAPNENDKSQMGSSSAEEESSTERGAEDSSVMSDRLFQVIDLDPYGTAAPFLDSAVQALEDGGLLCVTCTDAPVLCGLTPETCFTKYGSISLRAKFCHEQALRILLHCISTHAARHSKFIEPLLSLSIDFYVRVFVRIHVGQAQAKLAYAKTAMIFNCSGCGTHSLQPMGNVERNGNSVRYLSAPVVSGVGEKCIHCDHKIHIGGPVWAGKLHNLSFIDKVIQLVESPESPKLKTKDRIIGMLNLAKEELQDVPLYYVMTEGICAALHCFAPPATKFRSAILNAGYEVSLSHAAENSVKTNAPSEFIWDLMRTWIKESPINPKRITEGSVAHKILTVEPKSDIDFTYHTDATTSSQVQGLKRFPQNPESHWGPKPRAKKRDNDDDVDAVTISTTSAKKTKRSNGRAKEGKNHDFKKYPCKHFLAGKCLRGDDCVYSHDVDSFDKCLETGVSEQGS